MTIEITEITAQMPALKPLVEAHAAFCAGHSPAESCHYIGFEALKEVPLTLWGAWDGDALVAMGGLQRLSEHAGEVKSMHVLPRARGVGLGGALLGRIEGAAIERGYQKLLLETGSMDAFARARALYERYGYRQCAPFGSYSLDPNSVYYAKSFCLSASIA